MHLLIAAAIITSLLAIPVPTSAGDVSPCSELVRQALGYCPTVSNDGSGANLEGSQEQPGTSDGSGENTSGSPEVPAAPHPSSPEFPEQCMGNPDRGIDTSRNCFTPNVAPGEDPLPAVTITDVARFVPTSVSIAGEPSNAGVSRRATNFVAVAGVTVVDGVLFNRAVSVQFTPIGFIFDYGDGTVVESATGGASWESQGLVQFTPTDTSHVYTERGLFTATVTVQYSAHVNFGTGWFYIPGTVTGPPASQSIQIFEARNMLVSKTCVEDPNGVGC